MTPRPRPPAPRVALGIGEAADALGVGRDFFRKYVLPELQVVYRGDKRLVPVRELEAWLEREARGVRA